MAGVTRARVRNEAVAERRLAAARATERPSRAQPASAARAAGDGAREAQIAEIQRARLLAAAARAVDELGYGRTTVGDITHRARVSRRTFYELFANRDACVLAMLQDTVARLRADLAAAGLQRLAWREQVRIGLWTILCFLDREPVLARVCVVQAMRGGPALLAQREQLLAQLTCAVDAGRGESSRAAALSRLTAEGLVSAALGIVHSRLLRGERESLCALQNELMAMLVLPYLGAAAARRELARANPAPAPAGNAATADRDPLDGVPMRITYRTARVLEGVCELPGASNRAVGEHAGILDQGQVSKLLARLERLGLVANSGHARGEANAWGLTARGEQVAQSIRAGSASTPCAVGGKRNEL
jgi:AcrR family transcriptional regulator